MLETFRRHKKECPHKHKGRSYRHCRCPLYVDGTLNGGEIPRRSLGTRNWEVAQGIVREWEAKGSAPPDESPPVGLETAFQDFLADLERRELARSTIAKYGLLFRHMRRFAAEKGIRYLN